MVFRQRQVRIAHPTGKSWTPEVMFKISAIFIIAIGILIYNERLIPGGA